MILNNPWSPWFWVLWAVLLVWQNFTFTMVSRARNSGSLRRHMLAALLSNGAWFVQTLFVFSAMWKVIQGEFGWGWAAISALYYTVFTMTGSLWAHHRALKKEKGLAAVGASKKYAQIPAEEWERYKRLLLNAEALFLFSQRGN